MSATGNAGCMVVNAVESTVLQYSTEHIAWSPTIITDF